MRKGSRCSAVSGGKADAPAHLVASGRGQRSLVRVVAQIQRQKPVGAGERWRTCAHSDHHLGHLDEGACISSLPLSLSQSLLLQNYKWIDFCCDALLTPRVRLAWTSSNCETSMDSLDPSDHLCICVCRWYL